MTDERSSAVVGWLLAKRYSAGSSMITLLARAGSHLVSSGVTDTTGNDGSALRDNPCIATKSYGVDFAVGDKGRPIDTIRT